MTDYSGLVMTIGAGELAPTLARIRDTRARTRIREEITALQDASPRGALLGYSPKADDYDKLQAAYREYRRALVKAESTR